MLRKKLPGFVNMDRKQDVMVWRMGTPLAAFSMIALVQGIDFISL